jgi:hypothetical protein
LAVVDLQTEKIFGCKEGSKTWYHEKGHIVFNNLDWGAKISYYSVFFQMIAVFFLALSILINNLFLHIFTFLNALGMIVCYLIEESWAWAWGLKNYKKNEGISKE